MGAGRSRGDGGSMYARPFLSWKKPHEN